MKNSSKPVPACRVVAQYYSGGEKVFALATADASLVLRPTIDWTVEVSLLAVRGI